MVIASLPFPFLPFHTPVFVLNGKSPIDIGTWSAVSINFTYKIGTILTSLYRSGQYHISVSHIFMTYFDDSRIHKSKEKKMNLLYCAYKLKIIPT